MSEVVSISSAAHRLGKSPSTVRKWLREGAPCERPGESGRGHGARVVVADLLEWRAGIKPDLGVVDRREKLANCMREFLRRDCGAGVPWPRAIGVQEAKAAALLRAFFDFVDPHLHGEIVGDLPNAVRTLEAIAGVKPS